MGKTTPFYEISSNSMIVKILLLAMLLPFTPTFAEYDTNQLIDRHATYVLEIDEHTFEISYQVDADIIAMAVDEELDSFLIGLENASDSAMTVSIPHEVIRAEDDIFLVLVNGIEVYHTVLDDDDTSTFSFFVPEFSEEVEIIGTFVIPEFPLGTLATLAVLVSACMVFFRTSRLSFRS